MAVFGAIIAFGALVLPYRHISKTATQLDEVEKGLEPWRMPPAFVFAVFFGVMALCTPSVLVVCLRLLRSSTPLPRAFPFTSIIVVTYLWYLYKWAALRRHARRLRERAAPCTVIATGDVDPKLKRPHR